MNISKKNKTKRLAVKRPQSNGVILSDNPRVAAYNALKECWFSEKTPEEALLSTGLLLNKKDTALCTALVYEVLRHKSRLNSLMNSRLKEGKASLNLSLVLYIGLAQLLFFNRLGDHAIVSETVSLAKIAAPGRDGLVNAVLRGLIRDKESGAPWPPLIPLSGDKAYDLSLNYSYQLFFVKSLLARLGQEETEKLLAAGNTATSPTLRINPRLFAANKEERTGTQNILKLDEQRAKIMELLPFKTSPTLLSPWGIKTENFAGKPNEWPGFNEGYFAVQDEASQLAALIAGDLPKGAKVLDACAGLGGKTLALASINPEAIILAQDKDEAKLKLLKAEAKRLGCTNIVTKRQNLLKDIEQEDFDLILIDAPCSGLGVIRRRPDLKWSKNEDDISSLSKLQLQLLLAAGKSLKPGGRLLYGVCTFTEEEGPRVASEFLKSSSNFKSAPAELWPKALQGLLDSKQFLTLLPHRHGTDGFFWALFIKEKT